MSVQYRATRRDRTYKGANKKVVRGIKHTSQHARRCKACDQAKGGQSGRHCGRDNNGDSVAVDQLAIPPHQARGLHGMALTACKSLLAGFRFLQKEPRNKVNDSPRAAAAAFRASSVCRSCSRIWLTQVMVLAHRPKGASGRPFKAG